MNGFRILTWLVLDLFLFRLGLCKRLGDWVGGMKILRCNDVLHCVFGSSIPSDIMFHASKTYESSCPFYQYIVYTAYIVGKFQVFD